MAKMFALSVLTFLAHYNAPKLYSELGYKAFTKTVSRGRERPIDNFTKKQRQQGCKKARESTNSLRILSNRSRTIRSPNPYLHNLLEKLLKRRISNLSGVRMYSSQLILLYQKRVRRL